MTTVAMQVKDELHRTEFIGQKLLVYYGQHTNLELLDPATSALAQAEALLRVPDTARTFLLSPPVSPPIGWIQTVESAPVAGGFDAALMPHTDHADVCLDTDDNDLLMGRSMSRISFTDFVLDGGAEESDLLGANGDALDQSQQHPTSNPTSDVSVETTHSSDGRRIDVLTFGASSSRSSVATSNGLLNSPFSADRHVLPVIKIESTDEHGGDNEHAIRDAARSILRGLNQPSSIPKTSMPVFLSK